MANKIESTAVAPNQLAEASQYNNLRNDVINSAGDYNTSAGSANAYTLAVANTFVLVAGSLVKFNANFANTGAATLNITPSGGSALGVIAIKKLYNVALDAGDIKSGQVVACIYDGTNFQLLSPTSNVPDVQIFTASGTWTKPAGIKFVKVVCIGPGGAGGGGARGPSTSAVRSGNGGGGGAIREAIFTASSLAATETVTVGPATTGGSPAAADNAPGIDGASGTASSFGTWLLAGGGGGGGGGYSANLLGGGGGGVGSSAVLSSGGSPSVAGNAIAGQGPTALSTASYSAENGGGTGGASRTDGTGAPHGGSSICGGGGGGAGSGWDAATNIMTTGQGGRCGIYTTGGGSGESNATYKRGYCGNGGGGGQATRTGAGSAGTAGGDPGGGGGGSASSANGFVAIKGGNGARGEVRVYSW